MPRLARFLAAAAIAFAALASAAENITPLGRVPDWSALEKYQETITRDDFVQLLQNVYCTRGVSETLIRVEDKTVQFLTNQEAKTWFTLRFAPDPAAAKSAPHHWKNPSTLPPVSRLHALRGLHIALDPGHIGGTWARMEERWFQVGDSKPIQEGDMTLRVANILAPKLKALGAKVSFVRSKTEPATSKRPDDLE
ncbi:MAG TPA: hypothetical protein VK474_06250, partial [Chthoniobacterales bacterium]|nr:hypothetical protein [Chthoniobacterales bacterium]